MKLRHLFESAYRPKILKNWEVPKLNCVSPQRRTAKTKFITNDRGHLLPSIEKPKASPWGNYVGNWRLPKKIDRKTASKLNGLYKEDPPNVTDFEKEINKENIVDSSVVPYVPGDITDKNHQLPSHDDLAANRFPEQKPSSNGFPRIRNDFSGSLPDHYQDITAEVKDFCELNREMVHAEWPKKPAESKKENRLLSPIIAAISNFNLAKKLHKENLEHNPLPDAVTNSMYRKMQMMRDAEEPGMMLENEHFTTGVGWKGHPGYGPTRCTKMKIFRPKTCGHARDGDESVSSFDKKWRFLRQTKVTPMDLAICWDMTPTNPEDEPHRPTHIDGSNGSAAPAVFSVVHTPKEEEKSEEKCDGIHGCGPLFDHGDKGNDLKEYIFHRSKTKASSLDSSESKGSLLKKRAKSAYDDKKSVSSKRSDGSFKSRVQSAQSLNELDKESHSSKEKNNNVVVVGKIHRSTPNLSEAKCSDESCYKKLKNVSNSKVCIACELKNLTLQEKRPKSQYKMAFKAGVPQKTVSRSRYLLKVPKQKDPYMVKNYVIDSLAPPFSLQKAKRQDYPEHWRLATVYQHSYKPIHARKRPLLHTVFK